MMNLILVKREGLRRQAGRGVVYPVRRGQWGAEGMPDLQGAQEQGSALSGTQAREEPLAPVPRLIQVSLWSLILPTFPGKCVSKTL